ncbi:MAG: hypothetical protein ACRELC_05715 [Gemmatimonadota bacterium]
MGALRFYAKLRSGSPSRNRDAPTIATLPQSRPSPQTRDAPENEATSGVPLTTVRITADGDHFLAPRIRAPPFS